MRYITYILFVGLLFAQDIQEPKTYSFTEEQVLGFTNAIKELELKDSLNVSLVGDLESQLKDLEQSLDDFEKTGGKKTWYNNVGVNTPELEKDKWEMDEEAFNKTIKEAKDFIREKREVVEKAEQQLTGAE